MEAVKGTADVTLGIAERDIKITVTNLSVLFIEHTATGILIPKHLVQLVNDQTRRKIETFAFEPRSDLMCSLIRCNSCSVFALYHMREKLLLFCYHLPRFASSFVWISSWKLSKVLQTSLWG